MKKILLLTLLVVPLLLNAQTPQTTSFDLLEQETGDKCSDGCDNDGDGFIDCADLDCYISSLRDETLRDETSNSRSRNECDGDACLLEYAEVISVLGIPDVPTAKNACGKISEILTIIENDPYAFMRNCFDKDDPNSFWTDLAAFRVPEAIRALVEVRSIEGEWFVHEMNDAKGAVVNADLYSVDLGSTLSIGGTEVTPQELFNYIRLNFS